MKFALLAARLAAAGMMLMVGTAAGAGEYRLLRLDGHLVKWGEPALGKGAVIDWALLDRPAEYDDALNCRSMVPLETAGRGASSSLTAELERAFASWAAAANLSFRRVADPAAADIVIGAQAQPVGRAFSSVAFDKPDELKGRGVAAKALSPAGRSRNETADEAPGAGSGGSVRAIRQSLICLNPERRWKIGYDGDLDVYDLYFTFLHEIGHTIGLDHPGASGTVMGFRYDEKVRDLQAGDVDAVRQLYGPAR